MCMRHLAMQPRDGVVNSAFRLGLINASAPSIKERHIKQRLHNDKIKHAIAENRRVEDENRPSDGGITETATAKIPALTSSLTPQARCGDRFASICVSSG